MHKLVTASLALAIAMPFGAQADTKSDVAALKKQIAQMRDAYEARLDALEQRLKKAEAATPVAAAASGSATPTASTLPAASASAQTAQAAPQAQTQPAVAAAPPSDLAALAPPPGPAPAGPSIDTTTTAGANGFNPSMSLILSGLYGRTSQDPSRYAITGVPLPAGAEIGPGKRGFSLDESELGFAASIDPFWRGAANIALEGDNTVSIEEAYVQTTTLGNGISLKAGRFFSDVGYLNPQHSHTWDFVDNPLAYQAFLGTQYGDDGLQVSWLAPLDLYLELGAEIGRGRSFPGSDTSRNGAGMTSLTAHTGGDIGDSSNWRAGLSMLNAKANDQDLLSTNAFGTQVTDNFSGSSRVWIADAIWKWAPNGNGTRTNFKLQGEYLHSKRQGTLIYDVASADSAGAYGAAASGWYVQAVYQFMPGWRVGARTERLTIDTPDYGLGSVAFAASGYHPSKNTLMVDYNSSEFSRVRLQIARDQSRQGATDNQLFVQYQMSLGAHGAHSY